MHSCSAAVLRDICKQPHRFTYWFGILTWGVSSTKLCFHPLDYQEQHEKACGLAILLLFSLKCSDMFSCRFGTKKCRILAVSGGSEVQRGDDKHLNWGVCVWVNKWMSEWVWVNVWVNDWVSVCMSEWVYLCEWVSEWMNEYVCVWVKSWVSVCISEWVFLCEWVSEWMSMCVRVSVYEWMCEWLIEWVSKWMS